MDEYREEKMADNQEVKIMDSKCISCLRSITVEPSLFLLSMAVGFASSSYQYLLYTKVCIGLYSEDTCETFQGNESDAVKDYLQDVQKQTSQVIFYDNFCYTIPTLFTIFILGSWSDRFNRKIPILSGSTGAFLAYALCIVLSVFLDTSVYLCFISSLVYGIFGGIEAAVMGCFSYLSDVASEKTRTTRLSYLTASRTIGYVLPMFVAGYLLESTSFTVVYIIVTTICMVCIVYTVLMVRSISPSDQQPQVMTVDPQEICANIEHQTEEDKTSSHKSHLYVPLKDLSWKNRIRELCNLSHLKDSFIVTFKPRSGNERKHILTVLFANFCISWSSASFITYLFLKAEPIHLSQTLFTVFVALDNLVSFASQSLLLPLMKSRTTFHDQSLMLFGLTGDIVSRFYMAACRSAWMVFLIPLVTIFNNFHATCSRSYFTTLVSPDEVGKIYAVQSFLDMLAFLLGSFLYNLALYPATVHFYPGFSFLISGVIALLPLGMYVYLYRQRNNKHQTLEEEITCN